MLQKNFALNSYWDIKFTLLMAIAYPSLMNDNVLFQIRGC